MPYLLLVVLLAWLSHPARAAAPLDDAVWQLREMEITLTPSGATVVREHKQLMLLTERAAGLAQWEIPYDQAGETLAVVTAQTISGGHILPVNPAQMVETTLYPGFAWYDSLTVRRFPFPAPQPGAMLEIETVITRSTPRIPGVLDTRLTLQDRYPIKTGRVTIHVPADRRLAIRFSGLAPTVAESVQGDVRTYAWTLYDVPALRSAEEQTPPMDDLLASARLTTLDSWQPVAAWYRDLTATAATVTPTVRQCAAAQTADCATPEAKTRALFRVVRALPYVGIEMGMLRDRPQAAEDVLRQGYGDCKDKATLLRALLQAVGIDSDYVLVRTTDNGALDEMLYGASEFNHVILAVHLPDGDRYLDATKAEIPAFALPPGVDGARGLLVRDAGALVTLPTTADSRTDIRLDAAVRDDGSATGHATLTFTGHAAMLQRGLLARVPDGRYREALDGSLAPRLGGAEVALTAVAVANLHDPDRPLVIQLDFASPRYLQQAGPLRTGYLPAFAFQRNALRGVTARTLPFCVRAAGTMHVEAVITLPAGLEPVYLPQGLAVEKAMGSYRDALTLQDHTLRYTCDLQTRTGVFPAAALADFRAWHGILAGEGRNQLQLLFQRAP